MSESQLRIQHEMGCGRATEMDSSQSEPLRDPEQFLVQAPEALRELIGEFLKSQPLTDALSLSWVAFRSMELCRAVCLAFVQAWAEWVERVAVEVGRICPVCAKRRKINWREKEPLWVDLLFGRLLLRKPYLRCTTKNCSGRGLSVTRLLSGLRSGDSGLVLKLQAARQGAEESYSRTARSLEEHPLGAELERGKVRRLAIEVEDQAVEYREQQRREPRPEVGELPPRGVPRLMLEGDGGKVRVGTYQTLEPGERGYPERTPVRKLRRRRRASDYREVITLDVRQPEETTATALDVLMPITAPPAERQRLMYALARRKGLGAETEIYGLGDMGSGLADAFEEVFVENPGFWQADEKHTRDYLRAAAAVLKRDGEQWQEAMWVAILERDAIQRDALLEQAQRHRVATLPAGLKSCPIHALATYLRNNWKHMRFQEMKERGLPVVSARAESQVRDRTKARFSVAGAWALENVEPKAILRSIIAEGSFTEFAEWLYQKEQTSFAQGLKKRVEKAAAERRLDAKVAALLVDPDTTLVDLLEFRDSTTEQRTKKAA